MNMRDTKKYKTIALNSLTIITFIMIAKYIKHI